MSVNNTASSGSPVQPFVITRDFDAPRELVWKAWSERDRMEQWWGPKGSTLNQVKIDFRPGGMNHYSLRLPNGQEIWGRAIYKEIIPPERLVWVNAFSDSEGGLCRHPLSPAWPIELLTTLTLAERGGRTTLTITWEPISPSDSEREAFDSGRDSMRQGWTGTLDQLEAYLAGIKVEQ